MMFLLYLIRHKTIPKDGSEEEGQGKWFPEHPRLYATSPYLVCDICKDSVRSLVKTV